MTLIGNIFRLRCLWFAVALVVLFMNLSSIVFHELTVDKSSKSDRLPDYRMALRVSEHTAEYLYTPPKEEVHHIAFLKMHKAASSTVQNIFLRFGWYRNLTFVLPPARNPSGYPNIISLQQSLTNSNILPPPLGQHYDIMCNHVLYSYKNFSHFMPKNTVFIGILREPFELYKSILNYFQPVYIFKKISGSFPASTFLRSPSKYEPDTLMRSWTHSRMAIEYGFPPELFDKYDEAAVTKYLEKLDKEFKLMLIAENMDESIILMRRYLNWQTKDVIFLNKNIAHKKNESILTKAFDRDFYKAYAKLDYSLYNFFYKRLKQQIRQEGEDFDAELLHFQELRKSILEYCTQKEQQTPLKVQATEWGEAFIVAKSNCSDLLRGEMLFIKQIRIRQYGSDDI